MTGGLDIPCPTCGAEPGASCDMEGDGGPEVLWLGNRMHRARALAPMAAAQPARYPEPPVADE